jgi:hypothetical protein
MADGGAIDALYLAEEIKAPRLSRSVSILNDLQSSKQEGKRANKLTFKVL